MSTSQVQICNRGFSSYLGVAPITAIDASTPAGEQALLHYNDALQSLHEAFWWNHATTRQALAELVTDRTEWAYMYTMPATSVALQWVNTLETASMLISQGLDPDAPRELAPGIIYSNAPTATAQFTQLITDPTLYPQYFADTLSAMVAARSAVALTEDLKKAQYAATEAQRLLDTAIALDERNKPSVDHSVVPSYLTARGIT